MPHLFRNFLNDESDYVQSEAVWADLWAAAPEHERLARGWRSPWFAPQPPKDGNPIFSAVSEIQRRGLRIIQFEPSSQAVELDFWTDTFGGTLTDPLAIRELVIACALSTGSIQIARRLMVAWVSGDIELAHTPNEPNGPMRIQTTNFAKQDFRTWSKTPPPSLMMES